MDILGDDSTRQDDFMDVEVSTWPFTNDLPNTTEGGLLEGSSRASAGNFTRQADPLEVELSTRNDLPESTEGGLLEGSSQASAGNFTRQDDFLEVDVSTRPLANDLLESTVGGLLEGSSWALAGNFTRQDNLLEVEVSTRPLANDLLESTEGGLLDEVGVEIGVFSLVDGLSTKPDALLLPLVVKEGGDAGDIRNNFQHLHIQKMKTIKVPYFLD